MKGILIAGTLATLFSFLFTPTLIRILTNQQIGQTIRDDGPKTHHVKRGTPTMGGVVLVLAVLLGYFISHIITGAKVSESSLLVMGLIMALAMVGFLDDWLKVVKQRSLGLRAREKLIGQALVAGIYGALATRFPDIHGNTPVSLYLSTVRDTTIKLGTIIVILWIIKIGRAHV